MSNLLSKLILPIPIPLPGFGLQSQQGCSPNQNAYRAGFKDGVEFERNDDRDCGDHRSGDSSGCGGNNYRNVVSRDHGGHGQRDPRDGHGHGRDHRNGSGFGNGYGNGDRFGGYGYGQGNGYAGSRGGYGNGYGMHNAGYGGGYGSWGGDECGPGGHGSSSGVHGHRPTTGAGNKTPLTGTRNGDTASIKAGDGYTFDVTANDANTGGKLVITAPDGKKTTVWGDPHVTGPDGKEQFTFLKDATFMVGNTKVEMKTTKLPNGTSVLDSASFIDTMTNSGIKTDNLSEGAGKLTMSTGRGDLLDKQSADGTTMRLDSSGRLVRANDIGGYDEATQDWVNQQEARPAPVNGGGSDWAGNGNVNGNGYGHGHGHGHHNKRQLDFI